MVFVDANEADSLLPKPPEYGDANSILNGGPQNAAPPPPAQDYSSPPSFSPPAPSQSAYGLNYGSANNGDANGDGLNDQTGWANGVVQDYSSPSGFSYNGIPTTSDGAQYNPGPQQPQSERGYNLDFASPLGGTANDAPARPYTGDYIYQNPDTGGVTFSPDFQQYNNDTGNFQPVDQYPFDPNRSYAPGTAYDAMANHPNGGPGFLDTLKGIPGDVIDWGQRVNARAADSQGSNFAQDFGNAASGNHLINVLSGKDPNELPGPLPYVTDVAASPLAFQGFGGNALTSAAAKASADMLPGILGTGARLGAGIVAPAGEESALAVYGKNALAGFGGIGATKGADAGLTSYANSGLPGADIAGDPRVRAALVGGAGLLGGLAGYYAPEGLSGLHNAALALDTRLNEPVGAGMGEPVYGSMAVPKNASKAVRARGVRGEAALNADDLMREVDSVGGQVNPDGTVTVYHRTTPEAAARIEKTGRMTGKEDGIFFSTKPDGQAAGYGDAIVTARVPAEKLAIDDAFPDELHLRLPTSRAGQSVPVDVISKQAEAMPEAFGVGLNTFTRDPATGNWYVETAGGARVAVSPEQVQKYWNAADANPANAERVAADKAKLEAYGQGAQPTPAQTPKPKRFEPDLNRGRAVTDSPEMLDARRALLDALDKERAIRRSGTAAAEITAGRSAQAQGIGTNVRDALASGASAEEINAAARSGARVGTLRKTFAEPLNITDSQKAILLGDATQKALDEGKNFDVLTIGKAFDKLVKGEGVQPAEAKALRKYFGDEVANAVVERPKPPRTVAEATAEDFAKSSAIDPQVRRLEAQANAQHRLADKLQADGFETNNKRLLDASKEARARAIDAQNKADAKEIELARKAETKTTAQAANAAAKTEQRGNTASSRLAEAADKRNPNDQMLVDKAKTLLGEQPNTSSALNRASVAAVENWVDANRVLLDSIGETSHQALAVVKATVTGDVPDSYVSHLIERKGMLETALTNTGVDPKIAGDVADKLVEAELKMRYKGEPPQWVTDALNKAKSGGYTDTGSSIARGAAAASQEFKNTAFGLMDVGVFGQQVLHAIGTAGVQGFAGLVNKALAAAHLPHLDTTIAEGVLSKRVQYGLDGVAQGVHTGIVDIKPGQGTLLRVIPGLNKIDPYIAKIIQKSTDFQFGTVLGNLRNTIYEGNLVMAHLAGQDITNPAVRAQAAEFANAATSAGRRATNSTRALTESAALLSPSMTRAQIQQVMKVARLLAPSASTTERVLAATTIASTAASLLAVGKFLNDAVGIDDFEFDPAKSNFGVITLPGGTHVDLFPQEQFVKALATSMRVLAEGNPEDAATAWGKFALSRSSPILGTAEKATGFGYEPGRGYRFGDYGKGMSLGDRAVNLLPIPPIIQSAYQGDLNAVSGPLQFAGLNTFQDSNYQERNRWLQKQDFKDAQGNQITDYYKLDRLQKQQADAAFGKVQSTNPAVQKQQADTEALRQANIAQQQKNDTLGPGPDWRDAYHNLQATIRGQIQDNQIRNPYTGKESSAPLDMAVKEWGSIIDQNTTVSGKTNWDAVDKWMADNPDKAALVNKYMTGKDNTDLTPMVTQYKTDSKALADSGYFDYKDEIWKEIAKDDAELSKFPTYYDWKASIEQQIRSEVEPGTPKVIVDGIVDKVVGKIPVTKIYSKVSNTAETNWIAQHPKLAGIAYKWGYLSPTKTERSIIASGDGQ